MYRDVNKIVLCSVAATAAAVGGAAIQYGSMFIYLTTFRILSNLGVLN